LGGRDNNNDHAPAAWTENLMANTHSRRRWLAMTAAVAAAALLPKTLWARRNDPRELRLVHLHTGERLAVVYAENGDYLPDALTEIKRFLRDFRTGESHAIDPQLLDVLYATRLVLGSDSAFEVISGYRSPATNGALRRRSERVALQSLHLLGKAADVRLPGQRLIDVRDVALRLQSGGVGYYPDSEFVHLDTGRVRSW
jgi:uncharacterized protein YcbK (DUF882 family)